MAAPTANPPPTPRVPYGPGSSQSDSPPPNDDQDSVDQEPTDQLSVDQNDQKGEEINNETVQ